MLPKKKVFFFRQKRDFSPKICFSLFVLFPCESHLEWIKITFLLKTFQFLEFRLLNFVSLFISSFEPLKKYLHTHQYATHKIISSFFFSSDTFALSKSSVENWIDNVRIMKENMMKHARYMIPSWLSMYVLNCIFVSFFRSHVQCVWLSNLWWRCMYWFEWVTLCMNWIWERNWHLYQQERDFINDLKNGIPWSEN